jgi:uncharacterized protein (TIGR02246 family)
MQDAQEVRAVIDAWAAAVRRRDIPAILQNHSPDIVMFDVPPPFQSRGLEAYRKTWDAFFGWSDRQVAFDITDIEIVAGADVAFAFASVRCQTPGPKGEVEPLEFRLTIGLKKIDGRWTIVHEHHSVPAD